MSGTADPFEVQVSKWVDKAKANATEALRATATDALARVKELTPVDTGYLRANWTIMLPGDATPIAGQEPDPADIIARLQFGDQIILVNPVVYAMRIEYGYTDTDKLGRHYHQAGHYMMTQTIAELPEIAARATARVEAGQR